MIFESIQAILWIQRLIAIAVALQSLEFIFIRQATANEGIWSWEVVRGDFGHLPNFIQKALALFLAQPRFSYLIWIRLLCAIGLIFFLNPLVVFFLLISTILISLRWRGTFNGGSDYMTVVVLSSLCVMSVARADSIFTRAALFYISAQVVLSYFMAGLPKILSAQWRSGETLRLYCQSSNYSVPEKVQSIVRVRGFSFLVSWFVTIFELSFPVVFLSSNFCLIYISLALIFHFLNAFIFGLNRFIFAWAAAYPALYFCSQFGKFSPWR